MPLQREVLGAKIRVSRFKLWVAVFRIYGLRFRVWGLGFRVRCSEFEVWGLGFRVPRMYERQRDSAGILFQA